MRAVWENSTYYCWCRNYYHELNRTDASKAENWTRKAFNPFVVCNLPPMITSFSPEAHHEWGWALSRKHYISKASIICAHHGSHHNPYILFAVLYYRDRYAVPVEY